MADTVAALVHPKALHTASLMEALLSKTPSGVVVLDADFRILRANQNFFDQLRFKADQAVSKNIFDVLPSTLLIDSGVAQALQKVKRSGQAIKLTDVSYNLGPSSLKTLNVFIQAIPDSDEGGFLMVWDDISDRVEKIFELSMLRQINEAIMEKKLHLDRLLHLILTCVTAGSALAFNRAFLFLVSKDGRRVHGKLGVGPQSKEDAYRIWSALGADWRTLKDFLDTFNHEPQDREAPLTHAVRAMECSLRRSKNAVVWAIQNKRACHVTDVENDPRVGSDFCRFDSAREFVIVPLIGRHRVLGAIAADNIYSGEPIREEQVQLLTMFSNQAGLAIETAQMYRDLQRDRNKLHQAYQALKNTQNRLMNAEKLAAVGKMAAHVSHEIRNPLVTIGGFARTILRNVSDGDVNQAAQIIVEEVTRLEKILWDVLDFSRPVTPEFKMDDVNDVIRESCVLISGDVKDRNIELLLHLDKMLPRIVMDPRQWKQAILNVVKNAIMAMPSGGILSIKTSRVDRFVQTEIIDTGVGIPPDAISRLFVPFFTTRQSGSGLGLALTRQIVEEHDGTIEIRSEEGKGTVCTICLPVERKTKEISPKEFIRWRGEKEPERGVSWKQS